MLAVVANTHQSIATTTNLVTAIDLVNRVDEFYNSAWLKLAGLIAFVGLLIPFFAQYYQSREHKKLEKRFKEHLDTETKKLTKLIEAETLKLKKGNNAALAGVFFVQGKHCESTDSYQQALVSYLSALGFCAKGNDLDNAKRAINAITSIIDKHSAVIKRDSELSISVRYAVKVLKKTKCTDYAIQLSEIIRRHPAFTDKPDF